MSSCSPTKGETTTRPCSPIYAFKSEPNNGVGGGTPKNGRGGAVKYTRSRTRSKSPAAAAHHHHNPNRTASALAAAEISITGELTPGVGRKKERKYNLNNNTNKIGGGGALLPPRGGGSPAAGVTPKSASKLSPLLRRRMTPRIPPPKSSSAGGVDPPATVSSVSQEDREPVLVATVDVVHNEGSSSSNRDFPYDVGVFSKPDYGYSNNNNEQRDDTTAKNQKQVADVMVDVMIPRERQEEIELAFHHQHHHLHQREDLSSNNHTESSVNLSSNENNNKNLIGNKAMVGGYHGITSHEYSLYDGSTLTDNISGSHEDGVGDAIPALRSIPESLKQRASSISEYDDEEEDEEEEKEASGGSGSRANSSSSGEETSAANNLQQRQQKPNSAVRIEEPQQVTPRAPPGKLYYLCQNATDIEELVQTGMKYLTVEEAAATDEYGRTALHMLSLNHNLSELMTVNNNNDDIGGGVVGIRTSNSGMESMASSQNTNSSSDLEEQLIDFVVTKLWKAYRPAMITPDRQGYIPFQEELTEWIQGIYYQSMRQASTRANQNRSSFWKSTRSFKNPFSSKAVPENENNATTSELPQNNNNNKDIEASGGVKRFHRSNSYANFPIVRVTPHVVFCLKLLSAMIERMNQRLEFGRTKSNKHRRQASATQNPAASSSSGAAVAEDLDTTTNTEDPNNCDGEGEDGGGFELAVNELSNMTVEDVESEIVQSIASIPGLVKTVLLIEDEQQRNEVLSTVIMRRVLASKYSIGPWLTRMLQSPNKRASDRAIEYIQIVSNPDLFEKKRSDSSWRRSKKSLRSSFNGGSGSNHRQNSEENELYGQISRLQDFVPSLLSLGENEMEETVTTRLVSKVLDHLISRPFAATVILCDAIFLSILIAGLRLAINNLLLGSDPGIVVNYLYLTNMGLFYFIIRELGKAVSLLMMTQRIRVYIWSFWNLTDLLSTILAAASVVALRAHVVDSAEDGGDLVPMSLRNLIAVTTGFLWLRVLSFLKGINMQLATFVLAILQITRDVLWFCVILLVLVVSFGQMFFTILSPESCASGEDYSRACTPSEYYLSVYSILLGDYGSFDREHFTTVLSVILVVFFTFIVVLVLLNVLIAVASDSYEKCLIRSRNLFGRARVMLIAEMVSFQNLLRRNNMEESRAPRKFYNSWWASSLWANGTWSRGSLMFFALSSLIVLVWVIWEAAGIIGGSRYGNFWLGLASIFVIVCLFVCIMAFLSSGAANIVARMNVVKGSDNEQKSSMCGEFVQGIMLSFLGSSGDVNKGPSATDAWSGRMVFLKNEMKRLSEESNEEANKRVGAIERQTIQMEGRLRNELSSLETAIQALRSDLGHGDKNDLGQAQPSGGTDDEESQEEGGNRISTLIGKDVLKAVENTAI